MQLTFDQLPEAVSQLFIKLENIERILLQKNTKEQKHQDDVLNIDQAATFLHLARTTLYAMVSRREIPFMKKSKRLYFSTKELTTWLHNTKREAILL